MAGVRGVDFYRFDGLLDDEERGVRAVARRFVEQRFLPVLRDHLRAGTFPVELIPEMGALGLLGPAVHGPGCAGLSATVYGIICEELERGDSGLRSFASVQGSLVMWPIAAYGSDEQKERWLPELAAGRKVGCFGLTEPDHGSDPGGMATTRDARRRRLDPARRQAVDHQRRPGRRGRGLGPGPEGVLGFLVEKGTAGFAANPIHGKWSLRASDTGELVLDGVRVPESSRLPGARGLKAPAVLPERGPLRHRLGRGGRGGRLLRDRPALRRPARSSSAGPSPAFQLVQKKLVTMLTEITKAQGLVLQLGRLKDGGVNEVPLVSLAKRNNVAMALDCARMARDILGAAGITDEFSPGRHVANLESVSTYEGTHDIHALIVGQEITGHAAFR